jgi:hypothetical protein
MKCERLENFSSDAESNAIMFIELKITDTEQVIL